VKALGAEPKRWMSSVAVPSCFVVTNCPAPLVSAGVLCCTDVGEPEQSKLLEMLYADLRSYLVGGVGSTWRWVLSRARRRSAQRYETLGTFASALRAGKVEPDAVVSFPARLVAFGAFDRSPYLSPFALGAPRRGPPFVSEDGFLGLFAQATTHWMPVGLYPSPANDLFQGTLYEPNARACGVVSLLPFVPSIVSLPFVASTRFRHRVDHSSRVVGTVRMLTESDLASLSVSAAQYEMLRKSGLLWLFDMSGDEADAVAVDESQTSRELWGALYACGHFEFEKAPDRARVIEALVGAFSSKGLATNVLHEQHRGETLIAADGVRLTLGGRDAPIFSLHQDVELLGDYANGHVRFQSLLRSCLAATKEGFDVSGAVLLNPNDVDFSYADTTNAYTVLRSRAANGIGDPVALAIRDWHRRRSSVSGGAPTALLPASSPPRPPNVSGMRGRDAGSGRNRVHFLIVTALDEEREAVLAHLKLNRSPPSADDIRVYFRGEVDAGRARYDVALVSLIGMGRVDAATATSDAIRRWTPLYVVLVGIAGGVAARGAELGDVLLADQYVDYELQKKLDAHEEFRFAAHRADPRLLGEARNLSPEWRLTTKVSRPSEGAPHVHVGPIASGDKVIASREYLEKLRLHYPLLVGVEMEAAGAASAAFQAASRPGFFMVRAVSDLADPEKSSARVKEWRLYACDVAAAFFSALIRSGPIPDTNLDGQ